MFMLMVKRDSHVGCLPVHTILYGQLPCGGGVYGKTCKAKGISSLHSSFSISESIELICDGGVQGTVVSPYLHRIYSQSPSGYLANIQSLMYALGRVSYEQQLIRK